MTKSAMSIDSASRKAVEQALARSRVYKLLAVALASPDQGWFIALKDGFYVSALEAELDALYPGEWADLPKELNAFLKDAGSSSFQERIVQEHTNIFALPSSPALPYQTEYTAAHPFMKSQQLADILGFYRAFGLDLSENQKDRADAIVAELEFMHVLCLKEGSARARYFGHIDITVDAEKRFLKDHLAGWVRPFADTLRESGVSDVYAGLLEITARFLEKECAGLNVTPLANLSVVEQPDDPPGLCEPAAPEPVQWEATG